MKVQCPCGDWHDMSPTMLAMVVDAFVSGDMQIIGALGITVGCITEAFTEERAAEFRRKYPGNLISFNFN